MTRVQQREQDQAIAQLREWIKPGDTVYTVLDHVSGSGMTRHIRVVLLTCEDGRTVDRHPNHAVGLALGIKHARRHGRTQDALLVTGCGMDMGFHLVYELSHTLYPARLVRDIYLDSATHDQPGGQRLTREGAPAGSVYLGGYACLGKGKCPSNYHINHHDTIRCPGTEVYTPDGPNTGERCQWVSGVGWVLEEPERRLCPTCQGTGRIANPEGPERWDLVHTDGHALRHRWL